MADNPKAEKSQMEGPAAYAQTDQGEKKGQGIVRDERGQEQPVDKKRAQQTSKTEMPQSGQNSESSSSSGHKNGHPWWLALREGSAVVQSLPQYLFSPNGRIGRVHYWILVVAGLAIVLVAATIGSLNLNNEPMQWLSYAILLSSSLPILSATIRRLHDLNISAVYIVLFMITTGLMQLVSV
jgi:hypothetical protein